MARKMVQIMLVSTSVLHVLRFHPLCRFDPRLFIYNVRDKLDFELCLPSLLFF